MKRTCSVGPDWVKVSTKECSLELTTYDDVPGLAPSEHYSFKVRNTSVGSPWLDSFAFITRCKEEQKYKYFSKLKGWTNTYTNFIMSDDETVEIEIGRVDGRPVSSAAVHPVARAEAAVLRNGKAYIIMNNPAQIVVDIDGQMDSQNTGRGYKGPPIHTVTIFANPPLLEEPELGALGVYTVEPGEMPPTDGDVYDTLYFLPGVHDIDRGFPIWSGKKYYIPGNAIVYGTFNSSHGGRENGDNIRIYGYGTLSGARLAHPDFDNRTLPYSNTKGPSVSVYLVGARNSTLEGITIEDPPFHSVQMWAGFNPEKPTIVRWVKIFTWRVNGDGINPGANMRIEDSFLRTQDDTLYVKGTGMKRLVIWNDANGTAFALWGLHPNSTLTIEDCDIIYSRAVWHQWPGGRIFSLRAGGKNSDVVGGGHVLFRNIRVEDLFPTYQTFFLTTSGDCPFSFKDVNKVGHGLTGVTFQNITVAARSVYEYPEILHGHKKSLISNITFDRVVIAGELIDSLTDFAYVNEYVVHIHFK